MRKIINTPHEGFTLLELMITVTILLILMTAAVLQTSSVQNLIRFNNTFSKMILMAQRARNLAFNQAGDGMNVGMYFNVPNVTIFSDKNKDHLYTSVPADAEEKLENPLVMPAGMKFFITASAVPGSPASCPDAVLEYENGTAKPIFYCGGVEILTSGAASPQDLEMKIQLQHSTEKRARCFTIHLLSGVPQPEKCALVD